MSSTREAATFGVTTTATAFVLTMSPIASQSTAARASPRKAAPIAAANTGLRLMKIPNECAGTRRSARRSARNGTTDDSTPAASAQASAAGVGGWAMRIAIPTGTYTSADSAPAAADPSTPGTRCPRVRLSRM